MGSHAHCEVDDVNWRILEILQQNARASYTDIGRQVGLTPTAVGERVRRLEDLGVIRGYRVLLDENALGFPVSAYIRFAVRPGRSALLVQQCEELNAVLETHRLTGEDSYLLRVVTTSIKHLEAVIDRLLPLGQPSTSIVLSSPVLQKVIEPPTLNGATPGLEHAVQRQRVPGPV